jgi:hypothetical protein
MTSASEENGDLSIVFSVQGTGGSPMGPDPENRVGDQDTGSTGSPVSSAYINLLRTTCKIVRQISTLVTSRSRLPAASATPADHSSRAV